MMPSVMAMDSRTPEWAAETGPRLLREMKDRDLTPAEKILLDEVKAVCPCRKTNDPKQFAHNGENCEICGRQM